MSIFSKPAGVLAILLCVWVNAGAQDVDPREWAFAIDVDRGAGSGLGIGSATYLGSKDGDAYFATCYHVLQGAKKFNLPRLTTTGPTSADSAVLVKRAHDLVLIKVPLTKLKEDVLPKTGALADWLPTDAEAEALTVGYGYSNRSYRSARAAYVWNKTEGIDLRLPDGTRIMTGQIGNDPVVVRDLRRENTLPGMSGGPVVVPAATDRAPRFAGVIFARILDTAGLCIAAESIDRLFKEGKTYQSFAPAAFTEPAPFVENKSIPLHTASGTDRTQMKWESFEQWGLLLSPGQESRAFLGEFQEIRRDVAAYVEDGLGKPIVVKVNAPDCELSLNGDAVSSPVTLVPGENLLVLRRSKKLKTPALNDFIFNQNKLEATIGQDGTEWLTVTRSLPAIIEKYETFITLVNDAPDTKTGDIPVEESFGPLRATTAEFVKQLDASWHIDILDPRTKSRVEFDVSLDRRPDKNIEIRRVSKQTMDVKLPLVIDVKQLHVRYYGLDIAPLTANRRPMHLSVWFRAQWLFDKDSKPKILARALAGWLEEPLPVPLLGRGDDGVGLSVDLRAVASQLFVAYLNHQHLRADRTGNDDVAALLLALSGKSPAEYAYVGPVLLGWNEDQRLTDPVLKLETLKFRGTNEKVTLEAKGSVSFSRWQLDQDWAISEAKMSFDAKFGGQKENEPLGTGALNVNSAKAHFKTFGANARPVEAKLSVSPRGEVTVAPDLIQLLLDAAIP